MFSLRCKYNVQGLCSLQNLHRLVLYSTSANGFNQTLANYLINDLGFSQQQALSTSTKLPTTKVNAFKFSGKANSVVHFLKQRDFEDTHVRKIVSSYPRILCCNVDKTLKPKFKLLQDEGLSGSDLIHVVSANPSFVAARQMKDIITNLRTFLGSHEKLVKLLKTSNSFTTLPSMEYLVSNVALLKNDYGVDLQVIRDFICVKPTTFMRNTQIFRNSVVRIEEELGIPRDSKMFVYGIHLLGSSSEKNIESKRQMFKSFGWTEDHVSELIRRNPNTFLLSEENLKKKLGFFMNELGYKPDFLASRSALFTCSLEKRMKPRHRVLLILKEKDLLDYNFYTATLKPEAKFLKIIEPFKEVVPDILDIYQSSKEIHEVYAKNIGHALPSNVQRRELMEK